MRSTLKFLFLTLAFAFANASKCPEARKPHITSCSIFYECINLPEGGYVWAPSKCPEGLLFQPYLRLCVLPGDSWTCIEPFPMNFTPLNTPELVDTAKTSYHELNSTAEPLIENWQNLYPIMPLPLIEIEPNKEREGNSSDIITKEKIHELRRVFFYQNLGPLRKTSPIIDISSNEYVIQLIHNYIVNRTVNGRINRKTTKNYSSTTENAFMSEIQIIPSANAEILLNESNSNNIVVIKGNLGQKEYVTIEKYKSLSSQVNIEVIEFIPCTTGVRLQNTTDCMKYYTCDPSKPEVHEFTCPQHTAFNGQINLCDPQKFKSCAKKLANSRIKSPIINEERHSNDDNPCDKTGKFVDKSSKKFYYLCYINGNEDNISYIRLSCPNNLIFCEERKVCTSRRFCTHSDLR